MQGRQTRLPELLTALAPEPRTNRKRTTRVRGFGISFVDSHSGRPQRVRPAVGLYDKSEEFVCGFGRFGRALGSGHGGIGWPRQLVSSREHQIATGNRR